VIEPGQFLQPVLGPHVPWLYRESWAWTVIGLTGAAIFGSRFFFQWLHSERKGRLEVPVAFWHLSFWGSVLTVVYAFHVDKLPFILMNAFLPFLYARNLVLLRRGREQAEAP
jgi:lipid-A-disaccharide synthase-like uncharacterized protein